MRLVVMGFALLHVYSASVFAAEPSTSLAIFQKRIAPILAAKNPSSCSECHLSGVDLKQYIHADQAKTFAALKAAGLIDVSKPRDSKLLHFIARKPEKPSIVTEAVRREEYEAFASWIEAAVKDPALTAAKTDLKLGPQTPVEVLRHARRDRVLASFLDNVWSEVGRCAACHSPDRNQQQVQKHGAQVSWIKLSDPQATLDYLLENDLIDTSKPDSSLLLRKPTNQIKHGGGVKMTVGDRTYTQFRTFIEDLAATKAGKYQAADQLPKPSQEASTVTDIWLKLTDLPAEWDQKVLRANIYRWDEKTKSWTKDRVATADRQVAGKLQLWQNHLSLTAPRDTEAAKRLDPQSKLPAGKYLVKVYVDRDDKLATRYPYELGDQEFVAQVEFESRWPSGYGQMTVIKFPAQR